MIKKFLIKLIKNFISKKELNIPPISPLFLIYFQLRPLNRLLIRFLLKDNFLEIRPFKHKKLKYRVKNKYKKNEFLYNNFDYFGFLIVDNLYTNKDLEIFFNDEYLPEEFISKKKLPTYSRGKIIPIKILEKIIDERIIKVLARKNLNLYLRTIPYITYTNIDNDIPEKKVPSEFHLDRPDQVRATILLNNVDINTVKMQILNKSHKFNIKPLGEVINCTGSLGTTIFHNGNLLHRISLGENNDNFRLSLNLSFTYDIRKVAKISIDDITILKKNISKKDWHNYDPKFKKLFEGLLIH